MKFFLLICLSQLSLPQRDGQRVVSCEV